MCLPSCCGILGDTFLLGVQSIQPVLHGHATLVYSLQMWKCDAYSVQLPWRGVRQTAPLDGRPHQDSRESTEALFWFLHLMSVKWEGPRVSSTVFSCPELSEGTNGGPWDQFPTKIPAQWSSQYKDAFLGVCIRVQIRVRMHSHPLAAHCPCSKTTSAASRLSLKGNLDAPRFAG